MMERGVSKQCNFEDVHAAAVYHYDHAQGSLSVPSHFIQVSSDFACVNTQGCPLWQKPSYALSALLEAAQAWLGFHWCMDQAAS
jgi:hypothetical protein